MIAVSPADFSAVASMAVRYVMYGIMFSGIPLLVGALVGAVYRVIDRG